MKKVAILLFTLASLGTGMQAFADDYPNGCVDCHAKSESRDFRLNTLLARIGHGRGGERTKEIPNGCTRCHASGDQGSAGSLGKLVHSIHYETADKNAFIKKYGGDCLNCHEVDPPTGKVHVRSGERNWSLNIVESN